MKNKLIISLSMVLISLALVSIVSAFGVSAPYWEDNPLKMSPGETKIVNLNLQNMAGEEDVTVKAEIIQGAEIVSLERDTYVVEAGTSDMMAPLEITILEDTEIGEVNKIEIDFKTLNTDDTGTVAMGTGMTVSFNVIVEKEPTTEIPMTIIITIIVVIVLLIIAISLLKKKK